MNEQLPLGPIERLEQTRAGLSHHGAPPAEVAAAKRQAQLSGPRRVQVMRIIAAAGDHGITRQEIADLHGIKLQTVCGRCTELKGGRFIYESSRKRGGGAILHATDRGIRQLQRLDARGEA